jgi:hypothetical protein
MVATPTASPVLQPRFVPLMPGGSLSRLWERWSAWFEDFFASLAGLFGRVEPRLTARAYLRALLGPVEALDADTRVRPATLTHLESASDRGGNRDLDNPHSRWSEALSAFLTIHRTAGLMKARGSERDVPRTIPKRFLVLQSVHQHRHRHRCRGVWKQEAHGDRLRLEAAGSDLVQRFKHRAVKRLTGEPGEVDGDLLLSERRLQVRAQADRTLRAFPHE